MNDTNGRKSALNNYLDVNELGETPSVEVIRIIDQFFYGVGIVAFIILATCLYFNEIR